MKDLNEQKMKKARAIESLKPAVGFQVFMLNTSETRRSESSCIVDGMKNLFELAYSTQFKPEKISLFAMYLLLFATIRE